MGIRISTDHKGVKVWRSDKTGKPSYAIQIGKKEGDTWINEYQKVWFKGGADIKNGTTIYIRDAFPTIDSWVKDGVQHTRIMWIIMDYTYDGMAERQPQTFIEMPDLPDTFSAAEDEIPF